ncbi:hypothetical protein N3K66_004231 [Trichothecium roseum]|uniref:Uncharacterized protein n=1 Tax=Trichothecium roseum TaxID=47278 RepID=A0ACC0V0N8_9HYPO|nr:hypothetical protein N3K66_004231 [Trichothecium roseum]
MTTLHQDQSQDGWDDNETCSFHDGGKMAFWPLPCPRVDSFERDTSFFWQDLDGHAEESADSFGQFLNFDSNDGPPTNAQGIPTDSMSPNPGLMPRLQDPRSLDQPPESIGSSTTADEFDLLSNSSQTGAAASGSHEFDPGAWASVPLAQSSHDPAQGNMIPQHMEYTGHETLPDSDLPKVEGICLNSPSKQMFSHPPSPTPPRTTNNMARRSSKIVNAISSTIKKATNRKKASSKKPAPLPLDQPGSPVMDAAPIRAPRQRPRRADLTASEPSPTKKPSFSSQGNDGDFIHGFYEDPFGEVPSLRPPNALRYFHDSNITPPLESPGVKSEPGTYGTDYTSSDCAWTAGNHPGSMPLSQPASAGLTPGEQWPGGPRSATTDPGWWDYTLMQHNHSGEMVDQSHSSYNVDMHAQQANMPYEYGREYLSAPDGSNNGGLMIHMPQSYSSQPTGTHELALNAQTQLPPPPPIPQEQQRAHRPPRAPSAGARHLSQSPQRKSRIPSASPTRTPAQQSRQSSGGSISSMRSASGRLPASMPGTPCSVRKKRSRDPSSGGGGGGGGIGFVNFTPGDGTVLMTGVAPSGSSKTKARREKEALERRRKLSEAAIKAVAAAGGDVEKLLEQGFQF